MNLYIVGRATDSSVSAWEFQGVFDDYGKAVYACRDTTYFVGPAILNESLPHDREAWPGAHYPKDPNETRQPNHE